MRTATTLLRAALLCAAAHVALADTSETPSAPYPADFLQWKQIKGTSLDPKDPATAKLRDAHFVYANELAIEGLKSGHYPEGAVFVLDIFNLVQRDGVVALGERASTSTMVRDARFTATGGWDFEDYDIVTRAPMKMDPIKTCYECHTKVESRAFVFSRLKS